MDRRHAFVESLRRSLRSGLQGLGAVVDVVLPPACMACGAPIARAPGLCADCWAALPAIGGNSCVQCGVPLAIEWQTETHCLDCTHRPPPFTYARAPYLYDATARTLALGLKNGREAWAMVLARSMARAAPEWIAPGRLLLPVPLHRWRLAKRGYNQALLLAAALRRIGGAELGRDWLQRTRNTAVSRGMNRQQRQRNVAGAFAVRPAVVSAIRGAHITLVDDVMTTGATATACTRTLLAAGAMQVDVLTYARVAHAADATYLVTETDRKNDGES